MSWIFVMYMNGFIQDMNTFPNQAECEQAVAIYNNAFKKNENRALVWCESRGRKQEPRPRA